MDATRYQPQGRLKPRDHAPKSVAISPMPAWQHWGVWYVRLACGHNAVLTAEVNDGSQDSVYCQGH